MATSDEKRKALKALLSGEKSVEDLKPGLNLQRLNGEEAWLLYTILNSRKEGKPVDPKTADECYEYYREQSHSRPQTEWEKRGYWRNGDHETEAYKSYFQKHGNRERLDYYYRALNISKENQSTQ